MFTFPEELNFLNSAKQPILKTSLDTFEKTIVLTGATSGIGYVTATELAKMHAHLILVARDPLKAAKVKVECLNLGASSVECVIADLSVVSQAKTCAQTILTLSSHIDVLIHNAGMHSTKRRLTSEGHEVVFALNHYAPLILTHLLMPALHPSSHVLLINSEGHRFNGLNMNDLTWKKRVYTGLRSYGASKTAQLLCMIEMNKRLVDTGIVINAMHPGDVKTHIGQNNGTLYRLFSKLLIQPTLKDPHQSAQAIIAIITTPSLASHRNAFYHYTTLEVCAKYARDEAKAQALYTLSCEICDIQPLSKIE